MLSQPVFLLTQAIFLLKFSEILLIQVVFNDVYTQLRWLKKLDIYIVCCIVLTGLLVVSSAIQSGNSPGKR
jgi:hypothetical protein